jgi:hypothetical protein
VFGLDAPSKMEVAAGLIGSPVDKNENRHPVGKADPAGTGHVHDAHREDGRPLGRAASDRGRQRRDHGRTSHAVVELKNSYRRFPRFQGTRRPALSSFDINAMCLCERVLFAHIRDGLALPGTIHRGPEITARTILLCRDPRMIACGRWKPIYAMEAHAGAASCQAAARRATNLHGPARCPRERNRWTLLPTQYAVMNKTGRVKAASPVLSHGHARKSRRSKPVSKTTQGGPIRSNSPPPPKSCASRIRSSSIRSGVCSKPN